jgi:hypothetical protein
MERVDLRRSAPSVHTKANEKNRRAEVVAAVIPMNLATQPKARKYR